MVITFLKVSDKMNILRAKSKQDINHREKTKNCFKILVRYQSSQKF